MFGCARSSPWPLAYVVATRPQVIRRMVHAGVCPSVWHEYSELDQLCLGLVSPQSLRDLCAGNRVVRGVLSAAVAVGCGAVVEVLVRPEGGSQEEVYRLVGSRDRLEVGQVCACGKHCLQGMLRPVWRQLLCRGEWRYQSHYYA